MRNTTRFMMTAAAALIIASPMAARAQQGQQMQKQMQQQMQKTDFSDQKIEAYVNSAAKVQDIHNKMAPQLKQVKTEKEKKTAFKHMQQQMMSAIKNTENITVEEYNQITNAARQDQQLASEIREKFKNRQGGES